MPVPALIALFIVKTGNDGNCSQLPGGRLGGLHLEILFFPGNDLGAALLEPSCFYLTSRK